jgi:hypothetical protein
MTHASSIPDDSARTIGNAAHPAFDVTAPGELPAADSGLATPMHMRLPA